MFRLVLAIIRMFSNTIAKAKTCKDVFIYFYIKLVTLDEITVHLNIQQCDGLRYLLLRYFNELLFPTVDIVRKRVVD
jgi:hypothetical protein